ncbi:CBS domain-containing protein [Methanococcus maripaludis]|uniref:CBS domain-containing protein n=1 Tax=Methanococcus maripaludis TaxID=39152 RepID=A0A7J9NQY8_METMI|nr:CBS domain-containing protein [Methanococcus maripaludis]MBA2845891.1 CBS domain-containing protein [Methanococcus maripaludis]
MENLENALGKYHNIKLKHVIPPVDVMPVVCYNDPIIKVMELLRSRHHVWVINCKEEGSLLGVIKYLSVIDFLLPPDKHNLYIGSTRSALKSVIGGAKTAKEVMEKNALTINHNSTVIDALLKMKRYNVQILAVLNDEERLIGEISLKILIDKFLSLCLAQE